MTLRTPNPMNNSQSLLDLMRTKERYGNLVTQLTTGKRIVNVGDDPTGNALIMDFQASITRNSQYMAQIDTASNLLQGTETALDAVNNSVTRLLELAQTGMSETNGATARSAIANEVGTISSDLLSTANTQQQGKYIFAGANTTTVPFGGALVPPAVPSATVAYSGDNRNIDLDVSTTSKVTTNLPGDIVFYGTNGNAGAGTSSDIFAVTGNLKAALLANNTAGITAAYNDLKAISSRINDNLTDVGGRQAGMESLKTGLSSFNASLTSIQQSYEAVDYPTAITNLTKESVTQSATLSVMAKVNSKSLFDYLG